MNHVNAIRCNDEYQCSHCGKSWDIHEEAPDCKMTLASADVYKTVNYFGLSLTVPEDIDYIATDSYGGVYGYFSEPEPCSEFWDTHYDGFPKVRLATVNLHGLNWRETLRKC
ncbi:hypothetical protein AVIO78A_023 [Escherichia phage vB_EcoS_AVIO78A]|nr:hypothetical protein AVIO78A_023 [Escherichia phage vB_EcoS_AVIO78A]